MREREGGPLFGEGTGERDPRVVDPSIIQQIKQDFAPLAGRSNDDALRARLDLARSRSCRPLQRPSDRTTASAARVATIDWMRGLVMLLMVIDHASMAFDGSHLSEDSALYPEAATMALPAAEFFTRWITHLCAPTFVFLAGTALALSVERKVAKGANAWEIDKQMLTRGAIIALLDPTSSRSVPGAGRSRCFWRSGSR